MASLQFVEVIFKYYALWSDDGSVWIFIHSSLEYLGRTVCQWSEGRWLKSQGQQSEFAVTPLDSLPPQSLRGLYYLAFSKWNKCTTLCLPNNTNKCPSNKMNVIHRWSGDSALLSVGHWLWSPCTEWIPMQDVLHCLRIQIPFIHVFIIYFFKRLDFLWLEQMWVDTDLEHVMSFCFMLTLKPVLYIHRLTSYMVCSSFHIKTDKTHPSVI